MESLMIKARICKLIFTCLTDERSVLLPTNIEGTFFDIVAC